MELILYSKASSTLKVEVKKHLGNFCRKGSNKIVKEKFQFLRVLKKKKKPAIFEQAGAFQRFFCSFHCLNTLL